LLILFASMDAALSYNPPADCPTETDLSLLRECLDPPTSAPTHAPTNAPTNAPTKAPKVSSKSKGMMSEGGMKMDGMGMMSKKARIRYLK
jgi:hypothetical protein